MFIAPIFNDYKPLPPGEVRDSILTLAHRTKIPVDDVYWFDALEADEAHQRQRLGTRGNDSILRSMTTS